MEGFQGLKAFGSFLVMTAESRPDYQKYREERDRREKDDKLREKKKSMTPAQCLARAEEWKKIGNDKMKAGNFGEAEAYYSEGVKYLDALNLSREEHKLKSK